MIAQYAKQAALVVKVIPLIEREDVFALKGGTAINLFELDMPRLSVDIDLTFTRITDRETAIIWKRKNLETLRMSNPAKFAEQRKLLEMLLA